MDRSDTICAIATGVGGGIGIIRISGPEAEAVLRRLVRAVPEGAESHRLYFGRAREPSTGEVLDEVLACVMRAPRSYTGEANLARLLEATVRAGARVATPGEFTRRAFVAGRIDLSRAEAVAAVIGARSERALRQAQAQLQGAIAARVAALRASLVEVLAEVEARVDFPEEGLDFAPREELAARLAVLADEAGGLAGSYSLGRAVAEGIDVVLAGRTNAGKSSLLNALVGEERALVDEAAGTTRDFLEVELELGGVRARLVDTAGERDDAVAVERRGLEMGRRRRSRGDVLVIVVDGTVGFGEVERRLLAERGEVARIIAWNKCDLVPIVREALPAGEEVVEVSAMEHRGLDLLRSLIREVAGDTGDDGAVAVTSGRQREALVATEAAMRAGVEALRRETPPELAAVDLRMAMRRLGDVTGETVEEAVLDAVFGRFCLGK